MGTLLIVQEGLGRVLLFDTAAQSVRAAIPVGDLPHEIAIRSDGTTAFVSNFGLLEANLKMGIPGKTISVIDVARGVERSRFTLPPGTLGAPHGLKLRPPREAELFTNAEIGDEMVVFDAERGQVLRTFELPPGVHNFVFAADGEMLYAFAIHGEVFRIHAGDGAVLAHSRVVSPRGLGWSADRSHLMLASGGDVLLLDPDDLHEIRRYGDFGVRQIFYPAASPDARLIFAPAVIDGVLLVIDAQSGKLAHRIHTGSPLLMQIEPEGETAWVSNVLVPQGMFGPNSTGSPGGVTQLDLDTLAVHAVNGIVDTNGIPLSDCLFHN